MSIIQRTSLVLTAMAALLLALSDAQQPPPSPLLSALVPKIDMEHVKLTPNGNQYDLRIFLNRSEREETVELRAPGTPAQELHVNGNLRVSYDSGLQLIVVYEAGKDGYVVKYTLGPIVLGASPNLLKSAAG